MAKLSVWMPVKPLIVSQAFGIFNPAYKQFGFTKHNGLDMVVSDGQIAYAMVEGYVIDTGFNSGAGNYAKIETLKEVEAEGRTGTVCFMYMHAKEVLVRKGMVVQPGDPIMRCDSTGFSTGHHLHVSAFFIDAKEKKMRVGNKDTDYCFDWTLYWNKFYAQDAQKVLLILEQIKALLIQWLSKT